MTLETTIIPSWYVRMTENYTAWANVGVCRICATTGHYKDLHPATPCPNCGGKVKEKVGRWIPRKHSFRPWKIDGHWEVKREN